jgi:hypothetical protein
VERWTLPSGTIVRGIVREAKTVGLGFRRERASLQLEFQACELPAGEMFECDVALLSVDNARETVKNGNHIQGILAASNPPSWLNGLWYRPTSAFLKRSPLGLTGTGGMIQSRILPTPGGAALVIASRLILFRLPDPEITLPVGTDLTLRISLDESLLAPPADSSAVSTLPDELAQWLRDVPASVSQAGRTDAVDLINVAFFSTKDQLISSFAATGWSLADPLNAKSFIRIYAAFAEMRTYSNAPVSSLYYQGRLPDLVFQKSFNSLAKRHHIRLWKVQSPVGSIWLGAATHDTAIAFDWKLMTINHRIDPSIDRERSVVMNDFRGANCLQGEDEDVPRPELKTGGQTSNQIITDGSLAVGTVGDCDQPDANRPVWQGHRAGAPARLVQRLVLETRYYFTRGNAYYWTYQTIRWGFSFRRNQAKGDE